MTEAQNIMIAPQKETPIRLWEIRRQNKRLLRRNVRIRIRITLWRTLLLRSGYYYLYSICNSIVSVEWGPRDVHLPSIVSYSYCNNVADINLCWRRAEGFRWGIHLGQQERDRVSTTLQPGGLGASLLRSRLEHGGHVSNVELRRNPLAPVGERLKQTVSIYFYRIKINWP